MSRSELCHLITLTDWLLVSGLFFFLLFSNLETNPIDQPYREPCGIELETSKLVVV